MTEIRIRAAAEYLLCRRDPRLDGSGRSGTAGHEVGSRADELKEMVVRLVFSVIFAAILASSAIAFGNDEAWESGWGMGISEAIITKGQGNKIYVACGIPTPGRPVTSISFALIGNAPNSSSILLTFDGEAPREVFLSNGSIESASRAGASQFDYIIGKFREKQWVNVRYMDGTNATFTLNGASDAIGICPSDLLQ